MTRSPVKLALLTAGRELADLRGLEIGPRDAPLVPRSAGHVLYADHADTETLRRSLPCRKIDAASLVEIDLVTGGGSLAEIAPHRFDYIIASHVAEHVPDLLGWLADLYAALSPGGTLGLAIPDRRFTFDRFRQDSVIAEAVEAQLLRLRQPSLRQVFDSCWQAADISVQQGWHNIVPVTADRAHRLARLVPARALVSDLHQRPRYNDAHCWVFTPHAFLDFIEEACHARLFDFHLQAFYGTPSGSYEFYAVLRRPAPGEACEPLSAIATARAALAQSSAEIEFAMAHPTLEETRLRAENAELRQMLEARSAALRQIQSATLWRLTAPIRRCVDMLRGH